MSDRLAKPLPAQAAISENALLRADMPVESPRDRVDQLIPDRFEKIVQTYPNRLALEMGDHRLTYEELNRYANRISRAIPRQRWPGSEPIALLFGHGIDAIAAIFAVLKAGKFFLALDPASPSVRNGRALADSGTPLVVTNGRHESLVETLGSGLVPSLNIETVCESDPTDLVFHRPTAVAEMATIIAQNQTKRANNEELARMLNELDSMSENEAEKQLSGDTNAQMEERRP